MTVSRHIEGRSLPLESGSESLIGFRICFNLDVVVMLETIISVGVGLANEEWLWWVRVYSPKA
jgi:hypothetical protein